MSIFKGAEVGGIISHKSAYVHLVGMCRVKAEFIFRNCLRSVRILAQGYRTYRTLLSVQLMFIPSSKHKALSSCESIWICIHFETRKERSKIYKAR